MQLHVRSIMSTEVTLEKVRTLLKEFRTAMMITTGPDGALHTRPMALQGDVSTFGGTLWFFAAHDSEKMSEIGRGRTARLTLQSDCSIEIGFLTTAIEYRQGVAAFEAIAFPERQLDDTQRCICGNCCLLHGANNTSDRRCDPSISSRGRASQAPANHRC